MKILIADIPDEGLDLDFEEKITNEDLSLSSPVSARLELDKRDKEICITGRLSAEIGLECSRCLRLFTRNLDIPVNVVYHPIDEISAERHELKDDEMDMGFYRGEELDLRELLREQILLNKQMKSLCDENCRGICPKCGTDLNTGSCECTSREPDPRFEILKNFIDKRKE
ncbi:MAG: DUF177 domain-containing protein [Nitrospirae bacterium]|nr:DUF177 domain-containing protein [Nitrospirota bacterium]